MLKQSRLHNNVCRSKIFIFHFWYEKISVSFLSLFIHIYMMFAAMKKICRSLSNAKGIITCIKNTARSVWTNKLTFPEIWNTFFRKRFNNIESNSSGRSFVKFPNMAQVSARVRQNFISRSRWTPERDYYENCKCRESFFFPVES